MLFFPSPPTCWQSKYLSSYSRYRADTGRKTLPNQSGLLWHGLFPMWPFFSPSLLPPSPTCGTLMHELHGRSMICSLSENLAVLSFSMESEVFLAWIDCSFQSWCICHATCGTLFAWDQVVKFHIWPQDARLPRDSKNLVSTCCGVQRQILRLWHQSSDHMYDLITVKICWPHL